MKVTVEIEAEDWQPNPNIDLAEAKRSRFGCGGSTPSQPTMITLKEVKERLLDMHPYNLSVMEEHSTDDWMVICSYPCVNFSPNPEDEYSYLGCHPAWMMRILVICQDENTLDDVIWYFRWEKDIKKVLKPDLADDKLMKMCEGSKNESNS